MQPSSLFALKIVILVIVPYFAQARSQSDLPVLTGSHLADGCYLGVNSSGGRTDWVSPEGTSDILMQYPAGQDWGVVYVSWGPPVAENRPGRDMSAYQTLVVEMNGDPGTTVELGIKDSTQLDDGTEAKVKIKLSPDWQTYAIPLQQFVGVDLTRVYVLAEFVFSGPQSQTARVRSIRYTATSTKILPQLAFGGGWYSAVYFSNLTASPASLQANFVGDNGRPLRVDSVNGTSTTVTLAPRGTAVIEAPNLGPLSQGYVSVALPVGVIGYGVFRSSSSGVPV